MRVKHYSRKRLPVSFPPEEPSGCFAEMTPGVFFASAEPLFASPEKQVTPFIGGRPRPACRLCLRSLEKFDRALEVRDAKHQRSATAVQVRRAIGIVNVDAGFRQVG